MNKLIDKFRYYFYCKTVVWSKYVRIFCDGGQPIVRYMPRFRRARYAMHWKLHGFAMYWLGREFNFELGEDVNHLHEAHEIEYALEHLIFKKKP